MSVSGSHEREPKMAIVISGGSAKRVTSSPYAVMREAIVDIKREIEDLGYINLAAPDERQSGLEDDPSHRVERLRHIRVLRRRNPLAKNGANMLQHYALGQGITLRPNDKRLIARIIDEFRNDPVNKVTFTSHQASKEAMDTVFTDGEFFLVFYPDTENGTVELGHIDTMNVDDIVLDPKNRKIARWYKVKNVERRFDFENDRPDTMPETEWVYYRDWRNDSDEDAPPASKQRDGLVYHIAINKRGKRGESELAAAVDWIRAHKSFMEDRATINRAAASIAWKKKRKGPASDIAAELERLRSGIARGGGYENNPPAAAGSTVVENEASTLEWVKTDTGGAAALSDERILRMMTGAGMGGIPNHYQGDEASANLATATAMELPLLKTYEDWQAFWGDVWKDIIEFVLTTAHEAGRIGERDDSKRYSERVTTPQEAISADNALGGTAPSEGGISEAEPMAGSLTMVPRPETAQPVAFGADKDEQVDTTKPVDWYVDVDFPPIVQKDLTQWVTAMKELYAILPGSNVESQKLVIEMFLMALGANDVDQVMERLFPPGMVAVPAQQQQAIEKAKLQAELAKRGLAPNPAEPPPGPPGNFRESGGDLTPLAQYRVRRLLRAAREELDSDVAVGG